METWIVETVIKTLEDGHRYTSRDSSICPRCNLAGVGVVVMVVVAPSQRIATVAVYRSKTHPREALEFGLVAAR